MKKKKNNLKILIIVLALFTIMIIGMIMGIVIGKEVAERKMIEKIAIMLGGADIDIEVNLNETLLAEKLGDRFREVLNEREIIK